MFAFDNRGLNTKEMIGPQSVLAVFTTLSYGATISPLQDFCSA